MKQFALKQLSIALFASVGILGAGMTQAAPTVLPKINVKLTVPKGSAGEDKAVSSMFKGLPWSPCVAPTDDKGILLATGQATATNDLLQIDLDITNPDKHDVYVFFVNYSATGVAVDGDLPTKSNIFYALRPSGNGLAVPELKPVLSGTALAEDTLAPQQYRFMAGETFTPVTTFKSTLFGTAIALDKASLPQGLWGVVAFVVDPAVVAPGTVAADGTSSGNADANKALQNPANWEAWTMQPFVLGTPFQTVAGTSGDGTCK